MTQPEWQWVIQLSLSKSLATSFQLPAHPVESSLRWDYWTIFRITSTELSWALELVTFTLPRRGVIPKAPW